MSILATWTDATDIGYPVLLGGVLLGSSVIPVIPTGPLVGAAAALAMTTDRVGLLLVLLIATAAAAAGDLITFLVFRFGGPWAVRLLARRHRPERVDRVRDRFERRGLQVILVGHLIPAGRIPVLLAAGALSYPIRRLLPATLLASAIWAVVYMLIGVASGGIFDSPLAAMLVAAGLVALVGVAGGVIRNRSEASGADDAGAERDTVGDRP